MFQSVFALGIVLATMSYAIISMVRFIFPSKKKSGQGGCSGGACHCESKHQRKRLKRSAVRTVKLH